MFVLDKSKSSPLVESALAGRELRQKLISGNLANVDTPFYKARDIRFEDVLKEISLEGNRKIDFVMFGCPHFTLDEVKYIADKIKDKKLKKDMYILTSSYIRDMAIRMGLNDIIEKAGGSIIPDTCPDQPCWHHLKGKIGVTESPKCAYYPQRRGIYFVIRDLDTCIEAALTGEVK